MLSNVHRIPPPIACAGMAAGACLVAAAVLTSASVVRLDALAASAVTTHAVDPVLAVGFAVTALGGTEAVIPATVAAAALLLLLRLWHSALALVAAVVLTQLVVDLGKGLVERPRPPANAAGAEAGGFSFPSGHSATAAAFFGLLVLVGARHLRGGARTVATVAGLGLVAAVGASRIVLGAHYPTDVVAGWLTGATLALACLALLTRARDLLARRGAPA